MIHKSLFISSFKKKCKRICGVIAVIIVLEWVISVLNYIYTDYSYYNWSRILWHNYYKEEENIDYLYLGSSHVYCDLNPFLLDELNGENNFNLSTDSQKLNGSYYLLREADKDHDLKHVYVELYYVQSIGKSGNFLTSEGGRVSNWRNTDFMKNSFNRLEYMWTMSSLEFYIDTLFPFVRYRDKCFDVDYIRSQVEYKQTEEYQNYRYYKCVEETEEPYVVEYRDKGYNYTTKAMSEGSLKKEFTKQDCLIENPLADDAEEYLRKILSYCKKNDIEVTLFSSPMTEVHILASKGNYDNYVNQIRSIAEEYDVVYYDFNLCNEEYFALEMDSFRDLHHMNGKGADLFTEFFWKVMEGNEEKNEIYFYDSWTEKTDGKIYGLLQREQNEEGIISYEIASNSECDTGMEYRILLTPQDGETVMLQDFSENKLFEVSEEEHGICTVVARRIGEADNVQTLEIEY